MLVTRFVEKAHEAHGAYYDYSHISATDVLHDDVVPIVCPVHGEFMQRVRCHIVNKQGCRPCGLAGRKKRGQHISPETVTEMNAETPLPPQPLTLASLEKMRAEMLSWVGKEIPSRKVTNEATYMWLRKEGEQPIAIDLVGINEVKEVDRAFYRENTRTADSSDYRLVRIYEDEWLTKREIIRSRLRSLCGDSEHRLFARCCSVKEVSFAEAKEFFERNHIQGGKCATAIAYALQHEQRGVVAMMGFAKPRRNLGHKSSGEGEWELLRFANVLNTNVVGAASKLFAHFVREKHPSKVESYADRSWTAHNGKSLYDRLGFTFVRETEPNYWYVVDGKRKNRYNYRKDLLVKVGYSAEKTESQIMQERGIARVWSAGQLKFVWLNS